MEAGADANIIDNTGFSLLFWAAIRDADTCSKLLLSAGANVNAVNKEQNTALRYKGYKLGYKECVASLINAGADVNIKGASGSSALMWATVKSHCEIIDILINAGAHVNTTGGSFSIVCSCYWW